MDKKHQLEAELAKARQKVIDASNDPQFPPEEMLKLRDDAHRKWVATQEG